MKMRKTKLPKKQVKEGRNFCIILTLILVVVIFLYDILFKHYKVNLNLQVCHQRSENAMNLAV